MSAQYQVDSTRISVREYSQGHPRWRSVELPLALLLKLLRVRIPSSWDVPCVEAIAPYEIAEADLPDEVCRRFEPLRKELESLGFGGPIYHAFHSPHLYTRIYWATFTHHTGKAIARIHHRVWSHPSTFRSHLFPVFITGLDDGSFLVSSASKPDLSAPDSVRFDMQTGASATALWEAHRQRMDDLPAGRPERASTDDEARALTERLHAALRDFHLARGVFRPMSSGEQAAAAAPAGASGPTPDDQVLARLEQMQRSKTSWLSFVIVLAISGALFYWAQRREEWREVGWLLIPVLLFHEFGHYVAMRAFGYRNLRMFFIPFFGAAVMGKNYNVAGWKKAVVALSGPLPGIALGAGLGVAGFLLRRPALTEAAILLLALNGFNLLPLLPFDGGWVLHATLFCRHPVLDTASRALAVLVIVGLGLLSHSPFIYLLAIPLALALPVSWRVARVAERLREKGGLAASADGVTVPPESARAILAELRADRRTAQPTNVLAQGVLGVFENLNARPPGVPATLALLTVHGGSFLAAVVLGVVFAAGRMGLFDRWWPRPAPDPTPYVYSAGTSREWRGANVPAVADGATIAIAATFVSEEAARQQFAALPAELPPEASLRLFGPTLLLTLPADREAERNRWRERLRPNAKEVTGRWAGPVPWVNVSCQFGTEEEAREMEGQLRGYFLLATPQLLIPPWSAAWRELPAAERERFQEARRSLARLHDLAVRASAQPEVTDLAGQMTAAMRRRDMAEFRRLAAVRQEAQKAAEERLLADLLADEDDPVDPALAELWRRGQRLSAGVAAGPEDQPREARLAEWQKEYTKVQTEKARLLGALPLQGDRPQPGSDGEAAQGGVVTRSSSTVTVSGVTFLRPHSGLAAFADWLGERATQPIRYGIADLSMEPDDGGDAKE